MIIQKRLSILLCVVSLLSTAPVWAQSTDIEAAKKVVDTFYDLRKQDQHEAILELMIDPIRSILEAEREQTAPLRDYILLIMQKVEHKIVATEVVGNEIHAKIELTLPDSQVVFIKAKRGIPSDLPRDEYLRAWTANAVKIIQTEKLPAVVNKITMVLVKENGLWKITREQL